MRIVLHSFGNLLHTGAQLRHLSLDVALGAVVSHRMAGRVAGVPVSAVQYALLAAAVFVVYAADRLSDVRHFRTPPASVRHRFFWRNRRSLVRVGVGVTGLSMMGLPLLPAAVRRYGLGLSACTVGYLLLARRRPRFADAWFQKEYFVASLYTAGVWGPVWARAGRVSWHVRGLTVAFGGVALLNLLLFSWFERDEDALMHQPSLAGSWGARRWRRTWDGLALTTLVVLTVCVRTRDPRVRRVALIEGMMVGGLAAIRRWPRWFAPRHRYRTWGDAVFFLPVLLCQK